MSRRSAGLLAAGAALVLALCGARDARAFCRATTCDSNVTDCELDADQCQTLGAPLSWAGSCVTVYVQADASPSQGIDYDAAAASVTRAFASWTNATCTGGKPSISVQVNGPISCDASEYNPDRGNANIVVFRDTWPYVGGEDALGMTRVRFNPTTGEIYDADIELNTAMEALSVGAAQPGHVDLDSLLTHEAGHLLGLSHTDDATATMYPGYQLGSTELRSLASDDITGLCSIYEPNRKASSASCEPRHGFSDACGADQPAPTPGRDAAASESSCNFSARRTSPLGALVLGLSLLLGLRRKRRLVVASLASAAVSGCSLDTRELHYSLESGGRAGAFAGAPSRAGSDQGGAAGQSDAGGPPTLDGCTDLDEDGTPDCEQTLIENATFASTVAPWTSDAEAELVWDEHNAANDLPSGSALLSVMGAATPGAQGAALHSASQCLSVTGKQLVTVYANALVDSDQALGGEAQVDVLFFDSRACAGAYVTSFSTPQPLDAANGEWLALKAGAISGANTKSVLVKLTVSRPFDAASFQAYFDNVLLKAAAVE